MAFLMTKDFKSTYMVLNLLTEIQFSSSLAGHNN